MFGPAFAPDGTEQPTLVVGDPALADRMRACAACAVLGTAGDTAVIFQPPGAIVRSRRPGPGHVLSAVGAAGDPAPAADGVVPEEGAPWDSQLSVVLKSTASSIEVAVPAEPLAGVFVSADGNDAYSVRCIAADRTTSQLGVVPENRGAGMRTETIFASTLAACRSVAVSPLSGDGLYSVGEIGFLLP
jgi:hypothetical protein